MKKLIVVLAVLFIGILFAGCTSQSNTPAATPTETAVPTTVATAVPTEVPTTIATPVETANVTANVTATAVPTAVPTKEVKVVKLTFTRDLTISPDPTSVYVPVGTIVSWTNEDPYKPHGISATGITTAYFGDVSIPYGSTYNVTFDKVGVYDYTTLFKPTLNGQIIVI